MKIFLIVFIARTLMLEIDGVNSNFTIAIRIIVIVVMAWRMFFL